MKSNKTIKIIIGFVLIVILFNTIISAEEAIKISLNSTSITEHFKNQLIDTFKQEYGSNWNFEWNNETNTPHSIYGSSYNFNVGTIDSSGKAEEITKTFLLKNKELFKIEENNIKLENVEEGNNEWYVNFNQNYEGVEVFNGKASVTLSKNGFLISCGSDIYSGINRSIIPDISNYSALKIAKKNFSHEDNEFRNMSLLIYPRQSMYSLVWDISLFSKKPLDGKEFFIDAHNGEILWKQDFVISSQGESNPNNRELYWYLILIIPPILIILILALTIKRKTNKFYIKEK